MNCDDHCINLGWLWGDLQYLEVTLRIFLTQANPSKNYITNLDTFGTLVVVYNGQLLKAERTLYSLDPTVIDVRNALAHALVRGRGFPLPLLHKAQEACWIRARKLRLPWSGSMASRIIDRPFSAYSSRATDDLRKGRRQSGAKRVGPHNIEGDES